MGGGPPGFESGFTCLALLRIRLGPIGVSGTGLSPSAAGLSRTLPLRVSIPHYRPATPRSKPLGLGCCAFARHYLRNHCCFLLLLVLRCFTSQSVAPPDYGFIRSVMEVCSIGFPHSEIPGSKCVCHSPGLIAAYRVLHRLTMPRHPSYALMRLTEESLV